MGSKATTDKVAADMSPPNYRAAVQRLRTIKPKKDKISGVNGEIADVYAKVEGHKVNRKGAKIFMILDGLEAAERADVMRSIDGLADAAGWETEAQDLVDKATDNIVSVRFGRQPDGNDGTAPGNGDDGGDEEIDTLADEITAGTAADAANAFIEKARSHLNGDDGGQTPETDDEGHEDGDHGDA